MAGHTKGLGSQDRNFITSDYQMSVIWARKRGFVGLSLLPRRNAIEEWRLLPEEDKCLSSIALFVKSPN